MEPGKHKDKIIITLLIIIASLLVYIAVWQQQTKKIDATELERLRSEILDVRKNQKRGDSGDPYEKNEVKNTILKGAADKIQVCFKSWVAKNPQFQAGRITADWEIQPNGNPSKIEIVSSEITDINECVKSSLQELRFPPPPGEAARYISHKFFFKREEK